jgi:hypothetical protein
MALRSVKGRLAWFLTHRPGRAGLCARHTWQSLGNPPPPALGTPDAHAVIKRMKALGWWETKRTNIPKGAIVGYTGGRHGHLCLYNGNGTIASTDVHGPNTVGVVDLAWPERRWGMKYAGWTYHYGTVELPRQ